MRLARFAQDAAFQTHAWVVFFVLAIGTIVMLRDEGALDEFRPLRRRNAFPLHTSAVIFAFGGNALLMTSFYVVQRTCARASAATRLVRVLGLPALHRDGGDRLSPRRHQGREYAEPEWYVDLWLTVVWVAYLIVFLGTLWKRKEPHIYVANWFYLAFIVTIAMLHIVNNLSMPVSLFGAKSYSLFSGVQDAMTSGGTATTRWASS
jgi:cytochrome c oxidase cbb3-type subunit 1